MRTRCFGTLWQNSTGVSQLEDSRHRFQPPGRAPPRPVIPVVECCGDPAQRSALVPQPPDFDPAPLAVEPLETSTRVREGNETGDGLGDQGVGTSGLARGRGCIGANGRDGRLCQNKSFSPICNCRPVAEELLSRPKLAFPMVSAEFVAPGRLNVGVLVRLKASARYCT